MNLALETLKFYRELIRSSVYCSMRSLLASSWTVILHMDMSDDGKHATLEKIEATPGTGPEVIIEYL